MALLLPSSSTQTAAATLATPSASTHALASHARRPRSSSSPKSATMGTHPQPQSPSKQPPPPFPYPHLTNTMMMMMCDGRDFFPPLCVLSLHRFCFSLLSSTLLLVFVVSILLSTLSTCAIVAP